MLNSSLILSKSSKLFSVVSNDFLKYHSNSHGLQTSMRVLDINDNYVALLWLLSIGIVQMPFPKSVISKNLQSEFCINVPLRREVYEHVSVLKKFTIWILHKCPAAAGRLRTSICFYNMDFNIQIANLTKVSAKTDVMRDEVIKKYTKQMS